jgi:hypothetical protein
MRRNRRLSRSFYSCAEMAPEFNAMREAHLAFRRNSMRPFKSTLLGLAVFALAGPGFAQSASTVSPTTTSQDMMTIKSCSNMSDIAMMQDRKCATIMQQMNLTADDMHTMRKCLAMSHDAMLADQTCAAVMKSHGLM